jgi:hypothetical protein
MELPFSGRCALNSYAASAPPWHQIDQSIPRFDTVPPWARHEASTMALAAGRERPPAVHPHR